MNPSRIPAYLILLCAIIVAIIIVNGPLPFSSTHLTPYNGMYGYSYDPLAPFLAAFTPKTFAACTANPAGGGSSNIVTLVTASCRATSLQVGATTTCQASVQGVGAFNPTVTWATDFGSIDQKGNYTAPASQSGIAHVTATSNQDGSKIGRARPITITGGTQPPNLTVNVTVSGGIAAPGDFNLSVADNGKPVANGHAQSSQGFFISPNDTYTVSEATSTGSPSANYSVIFSKACNGTMKASPIICNITDTYQGTTGSIIPATLFGLHQSHYAGCSGSQYTDYSWSDAPAGSYRLWSTCGGKNAINWSSMNPASGTYNFTGLDAALAAIHAAGVSDGVPANAFITLGYVPSWISSNSTDPDCKGAGVNGNPGGTCDPPNDLYADGSGTDLAWRTFLTELVQHVTAPGYLSTHAPIEYYEIWNEIQSSDSLVRGFTCTNNLTNGVDSCYYRGTFAQMLRMAQDARCILKGIPGDPITGTHLTCGTSDYPVIGLDPTAELIPEDAGPGTNSARIVMANFLYCDQNPPANSQCNWDTKNPLGSNVTDIIDVHPYFTNFIPEGIISRITTEKSLLSTADLAKPLFGGEGSWNNNTTQSDPGLEAGYVARWYMSCWISGASSCYWYAWDQSSNTGNGGLWSPTAVTFDGVNNFVTCQTPNPNGGYDCTGATAYDQTVNWLSGATYVTSTCPTLCSNPTPGVFTFNITRQGGYQAQVVWDSSATGPCTNVQCGNTSYTAPSYATQWRDLVGNTHTGAPTTIGAEPIIVESGSNGG